MTDLQRKTTSGALQLQPFEKGRYSMLAAPLAVATGLHVVLELFDKQTPDGKIDSQGFADADIRLVNSASDFGAEMLRQALSQRQTHQVLLEAVAAALRASELLEKKFQVGTGPMEIQPPPNSVMDQIRLGLTRSETKTMDVEDSVRLAEAIRVLAVRHGSPAVRHCIQLVEGLRGLLDKVAGL